MTDRVTRTSRQIDRAGRRRRQEYEPALFIHRHRRPDIAVAGFNVIVHQRIERPARLSCPRIEGAHDAERRVDADIVRDRGADHEYAAAHHRRRRDLEFARP